MTMTTALPKH